ncbi:neuromedin-U receptor 2-like [Patiria miniata]|uniref:G-protein coupled receptors family 1 profile domain-containing protein n=1 Tax=Patiria miniata TaxID=46514 RepID=A0A913ZV07_PATMI|nr:neuromedin-U receptor 2-like [Patiria miniata]
METVEALSCNLPLNVSTGEDAAAYEYNSTEKTLVTIVMPWILVFGLIGNFSFLFVLWRVTWMRTTLNFFLTNLAIADIVFLTVSVLEKVVSYAVSPISVDKYFMGASGCVLVHLVVDICYFASVSLVTLVTLERYYATCRPHVHREHSTRARPVRLVSIVWFCSFTLACSLIPSVCNFFTICLRWPNEPRYQNYPNIMGICIALDVGAWVGDFADSLHSVPFVIAMIVNIVFFSMIIRALNSMVARAQRSGFSDRSQHIRDRVSRMLVINGIIFFLCLAPFQVTTLSHLFMPDAAKDDFVWTQVCRVLVYINSAVNPIVYNITNPRYRKAFQQAFTTRRGQSKLKNYFTNRSSNMEMNNRGTNNSRATFNSNAQTSTQQVKTMASSF